MRYICTLNTPLHVRKGASVAFSPVVEVSLACPRCRRADRTILLSDSEPAAHFGKAIDYDDHPFDGKVVSFCSETAAGKDDTDVVTARYGLEYEFESFVDAKYPQRLVAPQPTWARIHLTIYCPCGRTNETSTQTNIVRPRRVHCECGSMLFVEHEQVILFSQAALIHDHGD